MSDNTLVGFYVNKMTDDDLCGQNRFCLLLNFTTLSGILVRKCVINLNMMSGIYYSMKTSTLI